MVISNFNFYNEPNNNGFGDKNGDFHILMISVTNTHKSHIYFNTFFKILE